MSFFRIMYVFLFLNFTGYAPNLYAQESSRYPDEFYSYTNTRGDLDDIAVIIDRNFNLVTYGDLDLDAVIEYDNNANSPIIMSFDWPHNIAFFLPSNFDSEMLDWAHEACGYRLLMHNKKYYPPAKKDVEFAVIEQNCEADPKTVRYEYADFYGIQSFSIGQYAENSEGEMVFELQDVYSLFGAEIGFGAVSKE